MSDRIMACLDRILGYADGTLTVGLDAEAERLEAARAAAINAARHVIADAAGISHRHESVPEADAERYVAAWQSPTVQAEIVETYRETYREEHRKQPRRYFLSVGDSITPIDEGQLRVYLTLFLAAHPNERPETTVNAAQDYIDAHGSWGGHGFHWISAAEARFQGQARYAMTSERRR